MVDWIGGWKLRKTGGEVAGPDDRRTFSALPSTGRDHFGDELFLAGRDCASKQLWLEERMGSDDPLQNEGTAMCADTTLCSTSLALSNESAFVNAFSVIRRSEGLATSHSVVELGHGVEWRELGFERWGRLGAGLALLLPVHLPAHGNVIFQAINHF